MVTVTCKRFWYTTAIIDGRTGGTVAPQTKIWEEEPPHTHTHTHTRILVPKNTYRWIWHWWILPVSSTTLELFCPKMTRELPKKHHEAGLPEQAWNNCLQMHCHKSITDTLDTACEDWKEVWLCQLKLPKVFWKIWGGIRAWWKVSPPAFQKCPFPLSRGVPSIEETDTGQRLFEHFSRTKFCVPWMEVSLK